MATRLEAWLQGRNYTWSLTPQDIDAATQVWTDNAVGALVMNGRIREHSMDLQIDTENASPTDCGMSNDIVVEVATIFSVTEFSSQLATGVSATNANMLRKAILTSYHQKLVIKAYTNANLARSGSTGLVETCTAYVRFMGWSHNVPKGAADYAAMLKTVPVYDTVGAAYITNPAFS